MPKGADSTGEIEITPAMIRAGAREVARFNSDFHSEEDAAVRVYKAMLGARGRRDDNCDE